MLSHFLDWLLLQMDLFRYTHSCIMLDNFHVYCPGCGGTRAMEALLRLDLIQSLRYNPMIIILAVFFTAAAIQLITHKKMIGRKTVSAILIFWLLYAVVRDIFLVMGIDWLA